MVKKLIIILCTLCIIIPSLTASEPEFENIMTIVKDGVLNVVSSEVNLEEIKVEGFETTEVVDNKVCEINMFFNRVDINDLVRSLSSKSWHTAILKQAKSFVFPMSNSISGSLETNEFEEGEFMLDGEVSLVLDNLLSANWFQAAVLKNIENFKAKIELSLLLSGNNLFPVLLEGEIEIYPKEDLIYIQVNNFVYNLIDFGQLLFKVNYEGDIIW